MESISYYRNTWAEKEKLNSFFKECLVEDEQKEVDNNLETKVENLQKSNKVMKGLLTVLGIAILVAGCFGIGFILGEKSESNEGEKEVLDDSQEETDGKEDNRGFFAAIRKYKSCGYCWDKC